MKTYATYEDVDGFLWVKKLPVAVEAKQINEAFRVCTLEGIMKGKAGDYLMRGVNGELYLNDKDIFEKTYTLI
jgi:hypothetical protein